MQAQAAEFSGYAGKFRCFLKRRVLKQFVWRIEPRMCHRYKANPPQRMSRRGFQPSQRNFTDKYAPNTRHEIRKTRYEIRDTVRLPPFHSSRLPRKNCCKISLHSDSRTPAVISH
jgi:hypothetical protein